MVFADCTAGLFDGFRVDRDGRIWTSTAEGVHCYDADGTLIEKVLIPELVSNLCFGGAKRNRLFYMWIHISLFDFFGCQRLEIFKVESTTEIYLRRFLIFQVVLERLMRIKRLTAAKFIPCQVGWRPNSFDLSNHAQLT